MKKKCVVIFNNSWGEVDFILPALQILKNNNYEILIAFRFDNCFEKKNEYLDLYSGLKKISTKILNEENIQTQKFGFINFFIDMLLNPKIFFSKILNFNYKKIYNFLDIVKKDKSYQFISFLKSEKQIDLFLCADFDSNYSLWVKNFPKSKYFLFPHAITLRGSAFNHLKNENKNFSKQSYALRTHQLSQFPSNTILFSCDTDEANYFSEFCPKNIKILPIGFIRLEKIWIEKLQKNNSYEIKSKKKLILLLIGKVDYIGLDEANKKIKSVIKIAEKNSYNILLKNHPRNKNKHLKFQYNTNKIKILKSPLSISGSLRFVEFVIMTSKSGVCLDCIAQDKIAIEFYKYNRINKKNRVYEYNYKNQISSMYKINKLVYSFDNFLKLNQFVASISDNEYIRKNYLKIQKQNFTRIVSKNKEYLNNFMIALDNV